MGIKNFLPSAPDISRQAIIFLAAGLLAAFVLSRSPKLKQFVKDNSFN